jgi:hypothetical protein
VRSVGCTALTHVGLLYPSDIVYRCRIKHREFEFGARGLRAQGTGFVAKDLGFGVYGLGLRVLGIKGKHLHPWNFIWSSLLRAGLLYRRTCQPSLRAFLCQPAGRDPFHK